MENEIIKNENNEITKHKTDEEPKNPFSSLDDGSYWVTVKDHKMEKGAYKVARDFSWLYVIFIGVVFVIVVLGSIKFFDNFKPKVSANVNIKIEGIQEKAVLHVLTVSDSVVITETGKNDNKGVTAWTKFTGTGDFVVDLEKSEFLIDKARKTVIVKTPDVTIDKDNFSLDYNDTESLFFADFWGNESYKYGVEIAESQFNEAYLKIYDELFTNPYYYDSAKNATEKIIEALIRSLNKGVENLTVIVEVGALS